ncbi:MAG: phosphatidate cytidylyltransferase [Bacteroidales bacterium]|nr:phosphatidate cytidylyltransferase [Bacteroidales bacterium]
MNNLTKRAITGTIYVLSVIAAIFIHPICCAVYFLIISAIGLWEFFNVAGKKNIVADRITAIGLGLLTYSCILLLSQGEFQTAKRVLAIAIIGVIIIFVNEMYRKSENPFTNIAYTLTGVFYVAVPLALTNWIVNFNGTYSPMVLMSVFIFAWCNDTFAYLTGMKLGKHKLFERISPKKTWEGWIGGFVFTVIAAFIVSWFSDALALADFIAIAVITSVVGTFGDLTESMFKRQMQVKDSGNILPGHGGILDRFDILLLVIPAVVCYFLIRF